MIDLHEALIALNAGLIHYEEDGTFHWDGKTVCVISWTEECYCIIKRNKDKYWFCGDTLHRTDGPAIEWVNGTRCWYINDKLWRLDGPAVERANGTRSWYANGYRHRLDGPAVEYADGTREWWISGKLHREDGPAIEYANGQKEWWIKGNCCITEKEWRAALDAGDY